MAGHNVNIYLTEENFKKVKPLIKQRKVSELVNGLLNKEWEEQQKKELIRSYKERTRKKKLQDMLKIYAKTSWEDISIKLQSNLPNQKKDKNEH